jgi:uncharacterized membrane protein YhhN
MEPVFYLVPVLVVLLSFLIRAGVLERQRQVYFLKPISTLLVVAVVLLSLLDPLRNLTYTIGVTIGLVLSLGGDIALMFEDNRNAFALGLGLFLLAHVAYTVVFTLLGRVSVWDGFSTATLLTAGVGFYTLIRSNLGKMRVPVIAYMLVISIMVSRAAATLVSPDFSNEQASMIVVGALLFYLSDAILAANRFWKPWRYRRVGLAPYYIGQFLIALAASYFVS